MTFIKGQHHRHESGVVVETVLQNYKRHFKRKRKKMLNNVLHFYLI